MRTYQCDMCERTEPNVQVKYLRRRSWWRWLVFHWDSQGGGFFPLDICKECWDEIQFIIQNKKLGKTIGGAR